MLTKYCLLMYFKKKPLTTCKILQYRNVFSQCILMSSFGSHAQRKTKMLEKEKSNRNNPSNYCAFVLSAAKCKLDLCHDMGLDFSSKRQTGSQSWWLGWSWYKPICGSFVWLKWAMQWKRQGMSICNADFVPSTKIKYQTCC